MLLMLRYTCVSMPLWLNNKWTVVIVTVQQIATDRNQSTWADFKLM